MPDKSYDRLNTGSKCCFIFLLSILTFPFGTIFLLFFYACYDGEPNIREQLKEAEEGPSYHQIKHANQSWFGCQAITSCLYFHCPIGVDFVKKMTLAQAIRRYSDHFILNEKQRLDTFNEIIRSNPYLEFVLRNINENKPQFFFKILPSGSLREGFGKMLPSTSILASDYDLMLVPDAIHVQPTEVVVSYDGRAPSVTADEVDDGVKDVDEMEMVENQFNRGHTPSFQDEYHHDTESPLLGNRQQIDDVNVEVSYRPPPVKPLPPPPNSGGFTSIDLQHQPFQPQQHHSGSEESLFTTSNDEPPVFDALIDPKEEDKIMPDGHLWLKLNNRSLSQWKELCYPRQHNKQTEFFLSHLAVYREIRKAIGQIKDHKRFFQTLTDADLKDLDLVVEHNGPAVTIKVDQDEYQERCCGGRGRKGSERADRIRQRKCATFCELLFCVGLIVLVVFLFAVDFVLGLILAIFVGVPAAVDIIVILLVAMCGSCGIDGKSNEQRELEERRNLIKRKQLFEGDFTLALHCPEFPVDAQKAFFESRKRGSKNYQQEKFWPSSDAVKRIKRIGCHVVPKPSEKKLVFYVDEQSESTYLAQSAILEWRFSFSQPEIILAGEVHWIARQVYMAFKATIKRHISAVRDAKTNVYCKLPSYVLKTIFFRNVEAKPLAYWEGYTFPNMKTPLEKMDAVTEDFFKILMNSLVHDINERREILLLSEEERRKTKRVACPHFWLPKIDLLKDVSLKEVEFIQRRLVEIMKSEDALKSKVADNWLETQDFVRRSCCSSCYVNQQNVAVYSDVKQPCNHLCMCSVDRQDEMTCNGPMDYNEEHFYVY